MKRFDQFIKEEIDLKGNAGIPDDLMANADKQAEKNLKVRLDDERQMPQIGAEIGRLGMQYMEILFERGRIRPGSQQVKDKYAKIEQLAKDIILENYSDILEASEKPIDIIMKIIDPMQGGANTEIPEITDVPVNPPKEKFEDDEVKKSVDKKKILNVLNQGAGKNTKSIIQYSKLVEPGLKDIFGNDWKRVLDIWLKISELSAKTDWVVPTEVTSNMMKDAPQGMVGAVQVKWEKDEENEDEDEQDDSEKEITVDEDGTQFVGDEDNYDRITIKAVGVDLPMLIHESVKGIWSLLKSGSIKNDEELAKLIADNTGTFSDEAQDFRYGVSMQAMFRDFISACKDSDKYSNMMLRVYAKLALDIDNGGDFEDGEFLEISKSIFSSFNLEDGATLEFVLDEEKFNSSMAKKKIEGLISDIVQAEKDYEKQLSEWEMDQKFDNNDKEEQDDVDGEEFNNFLSDYGISSEKEEVEEEQDLSKLKQSEIQELIDDALDREDYAEVARVSKYLKEGKEIYLRELERINESLSRRRKNK